MIITIMKIIKIEKGITLILSMRIMIKVFVVLIETNVLIEVMSLIQAFLKVFIIMSNFKNVFFGSWLNFVSSTPKILKVIGDFKSLAV